ncbi:integrase [Gossypium australe]|uniref:Integrase n=1 Tax=Gossypium australe TaxID=47621 RepID=A0A5B6X0U2_9ROSI|nr:integrase [Gossypium australe]
MKRDISELVYKSLICQQVKAEHQPVTIPKLKWDKVTMNFISGLPLSLKKEDVIWVIIDRLTKLSDCMVCQFPLFLIEIYSSHPDSEKLQEALVLHFILRWMVNLNICFSVVFWNLKAIGKEILAVSRNCI